MRVKHFFLIVTTTSLMFGCLEQEEKLLEVEHVVKVTEDKSGADSMLELMEEEPTLFSQEFANEEAFALHVRTGREIRLTNSKGPERSAMLSPDLRHVAFAAVDVGIRDLESKELRWITQEMMCSQPRWNPPGTVIAFVGSRKRPLEESSEMVYYDPDLYVVSPEDEDLVNLTDSEDASEFSYDWSHDGNAIAYLAKDAAGRIGCFVLSLNDGGKKEIPSQYLKDLFPEAVAWSNTANVITLSSESNGATEFYDVDIGTGHCEVLGSVGGLRSGKFDRCGETGRIVVGVSSDDVGKSIVEKKAGFDVLGVWGDCPAWSYDGRYVTYTRLDVPQGLVQNLKQGRLVELSDPLIIVRKAGGVEMSTDIWKQYTPVVKEGQAKKNGRPTLENMSKREAIDALGDGSSLASQIADRAWEK